MLKTTSGVSRPRSFRERIVILLFSGRHYNATFTSSGHLLCLCLLLVQLLVNNTKITCHIQNETSIKDNEFSSYYPCIDAMNSVATGPFGKANIVFQIRQAVSTMPIERFPSPGPFFPQKTKKVLLSSYQLLFEHAHAYRCLGTVPANKQTSKRYTYRIFEHNYVKL